MKGKLQEFALCMILNKKLTCSRWGDAPVHSIAAALLLHKEEFHFFNDIGYRHTSYTHCPVEEKYRSKCSCNPNINFDYDINLSCLPIYEAAMAST